MQTKTTWLIIASFLLTEAAAWAGSVKTLEDIHFWTGSGENRAAVVIDWDSAATDDLALVWGFRWSGSATGEDMLRAVLTADPRLYAKFGSTGPLGVPVYGLGYDLNNDALFGITDGTEFDEQGIAFSGVPDPPPQTVVGSANYPADSYAEGFFTGSWNYGVSVGQPFAGGSWVSSLVGLSQRELTDGDWNSWAFETPPSVFSTAFAANPIAAEAPLLADFDEDDDIDGVDFLSWQRGFGTLVGAELGQGDANSDGRIDELDLQLWSNGFGSRSNLNRVGASVPEPRSCWCLLFVLFLFLGTGWLHSDRTLRRCI